MRLAVVGSRDFDEGSYWVVRNAILHVAHRIEWDVTLVSGGARGVDRMAERAASEFDVPIEVYPADWKRHGKRAGFLRNQTIVDRADHLLAFFGPTRTPGTSDTIRRAIVKGIPVDVFEEWYSTRMGVNAWVGVDTSEGFYGGWSVEGDPLYYEWDESEMTTASGGTPGEVRADLIAIARRYRERTDELNAELRDDSMSSGEPR